MKKMCVEARGRRAMAAGVSVLILTASGLAGDGPYEVVDLGTLGGSASAALGLNDHGHVVGVSLQPGDEWERAFLYDGDGLRDLGVLAGDEESTARDINNAGRIVGTSQRNVIAGSGDYFPVEFVPGGPVLLPAVLGGSGEGWASAINEAGRITGYSWNGANREVGVIWEADGSLTNIGQYSGAESTRPMGMNELGVVVGWEYTPGSFQPNDAFLYDGSGGPGGWFTIGGFDAPWQNAEAYDVNNTGMAVGYMGFPSAPWHGAVWVFGQPGAIDVGGLPGFPWTELYRVNDAGQAVGRAYDDAFLNFRGVMWTESDGLVDLNDLLPAGYDGAVVEASDINENGEIAATVLIDGAWRAVLLRPAAAGPVGDLDGDGAVGSSDLALLLAAWGPCPDCDADLDGDGDVDASDLAMLLSNWS